MIKFKKNKILAVILTLILLIPLPIYGQESKLELDYIDHMMKFTQENYIKEIPREKLIENSLKGIFENLDNYSEYYSPEEFSDIMERIDGNFVGIGAYIMKGYEYPEIVDTIKSSPAEKSGLVSGDVILSIAGKSARGISAKEATDLIKGEAGTKVRLRIKRGDSQFNLIIERARVEINPVEYEIIEDIGYIRLDQFNSNAYKEVKKALNHMDNLNIDNIILDLRDNPGGHLDQAIYIGREFIKEGPLTHIKYRNKDTVTYKSYLKKKKYNLILLINEYSASASEILAAAVKDTNSGVIIGKNTFGKGTVQEVLALRRGDGIKITVAEYFSPNMNKIDGIGVRPNIEVENSYGIDAQLEKAIELFTNP